MKKAINIFLISVLVKSIVFAQANKNFIHTYTATEPTTSESTLENWPKENKLESVQFFDGLGRPDQTISKKASPGGYDIIQFFDYDSYGREKLKYLPYVAGTITNDYRTNPLSEQSSFYATTSSYNNKVIRDSSPFAEKDFEPSPLSRVLEVGSMGSAWQLATNKTIKTAYEANGDREVIDWQIQADGTLRTTSTPYFAADRLNKVITEDEEGNRLVQYTDKEGRVILKKAEVTEGAADEHHEGWACTYYIYDDYGNLRYVLPPACLDEILNDSMEDYENDGGTVLTANTTFSSNNSGAYYYLPWVTVTLSPTANFTNGFSIQLLPLEITADRLNRWAFQYKYDARNRLIEKKVPGAEWVYMVYDKRDRLVLTQDGVQRSSYQWLFTKYDELNRPVITGIYTNSSYTTQATMQTYVNGQVGSTCTWYESLKISGGTHGYDNLAFPKTGISKYLTVTYYDNYLFLGLSEFTSTYDFGSNNGIYTETQNTYVRGQVTGGKVLNLEDNAWLLSATYYDHKYRVIRAFSGHIKGVNKVYSKYDFGGNVTNTQLVHTYTNEPTITINEAFTYDHTNRLLTATHQVNGGDVITLLKNEYNELGELVDKKLHSDDGTNFQQSVDYRYNIRGWLTSINNAALNTASNNDDSDDYFGMELGYNTTLGIGSKTAFNGNISQIKWSTFNNTGGSTQYAYEYDYDNLNRLKDAEFYSNAGSWSNSRGLDADFSYDMNGNITKLTRQNKDATTIDNLTYNYGSEGSLSNQLLKVDDSGTSSGFDDGSNTGNDYSYDDNGNLTVDNNKGITEIQYNHLNLPRYIRKSATDNITYKYDATGIKLSKVAMVSGAVTTTNYIGNFIYENNKLQYILHPEGRIVVQRDGSNNISGYEYQYHMKDHLGNTRLTFSSDPDPTTYEATMESENASFEGQYFDNISRLAGTGLNTTTGGNEVLALNGSNKVGATFAMEVMPGDIINIDVNAAYESGSNYSSTTSSSAMIAAIAASFGGVSGGGGESGQIFDAINEAIGAIGLGGSQGSSQPAAYLTCLVFDRNLNVISNKGGFVDVSGNTSGSMQNFGLSTINITQRGYIYVYLSNESTDSKFAFFDDLNIEITSPIVQADDYYPFGMSIAESEYRNSFGKENDFLYNGKELQSDLNLDWYDYGARMYDPAIARWHVIDPLAEKYRRWSPYNYCVDNPLKFTDPDGMRVEFHGDKDKKAFRQLRASTNYKLKFDKKTGEVSVGNLRKGATATAADNKLRDAINDKNITVKVNATKSNFTKSGHWYVGGAYGGSTKNADGTVTTNQTVNPNMTAKIDNFYGAPKGVSTLHEVIESYVGGQDSPGQGAPTFADVQNKTAAGTAYESAHKKTEAIDPRHVAPNTSVDPNTGQVYISKYPYGSVPQFLNPEMIINDLSK